jgi:NAD-dependent DNA ligase
MIKNPEALINRRRRQIHVHSIIYYHLNTSIVSDAVFDGWAKELVGLNRSYPELLHKGYSPTLFADWTGDTGMHLPAYDATLSLAESLLRTSVKKKWAQVPLSKNDAWKGDVGYSII